MVEPLRRIAAGVYETLDGEHRIIRTDGWEGTRGGNLRRWEHAVLDRSTWVIDGDIFERTLREARARLSAALNQRERSS